jgi:hypothetical protein
MRESAKGLIEISREMLDCKYRNETMFVLAMEPKEVNGKHDCYEYGSEFDVYEGFYGCPVEQCGTKEEVIRHIQMCIDNNIASETEKHFLNILEDL